MLPAMVVRTGHGLCRHRFASPPKTAGHLQTLTEDLKGPRGVARMQVFPLVGHRLRRECPMRLPSV